ncbi:uncharacterized protein LOC116160073 [Photinus pyralis]|nr:uncharacterized protein LOC116160073 [Photinus pyralis]
MGERARKILGLLQDNAGTLGSSTNRNTSTTKSNSEIEGNNQTELTNEFHLMPFYVPHETKTSGNCEFPNSNTLTELKNVFDGWEYNNDNSENNEEGLNNDSSKSDEDPYATDSDSDYVPEDIVTMEKESDSIEVAQNHNSNSPQKSDIEEVKKSSTKRKRNENIWKRNVAKTLRNSGKSYVNIRNKVVRERKLKKSCSENCRLKCPQKICENMREKIFAQFWKLGDVDRQRDFIARFVDFKEKKRVRVRNSTPSSKDLDKGEPEISNTSDLSSRRRMTYFYHFVSEENKREKVCQTFFLNTLDISHQVVKTVANRLSGVENNNIVISKDQRGKTPCTIRLTDEQKGIAKDHINSFEKIESHYCRKDSAKQYLHSSLNVSKMYRMYCEYCANINKGPIRESAYRAIFKNEFNLGFHIPKKDQCDLCTNFEHCVGKEKEVLEAKVTKHLQNKDVIRTQKELDKQRANSDPNFCVCVFDLQQVLPCPKIEVGPAYYKSKLSTFNLTVFDIGKKQGYCFMWHEVIAARGSCEIGSCILAFLKRKALEDNCTEFSFYADNCAGQNKNKFLYVLLLYAAVTYNLKITLRFMEVGHTQNEGDSMHSVIERCARRIPVYTPAQWYTIARVACIKKPYIVKEMEQKDFFDLKNLLSKTTKNIDKDVLGTPGDSTKIKFVQNWRLLRIC